MRCLFTSVDRRWLIYASLRLMEYGGNRKFSLLPPLVIRPRGTQLVKLTCVLQIITRVHCIPELSLWAPWLPHTRRRNYSEVLLHVVTRG